MERLEDEVDEAEVEEAEADEYATEGAPAADTASSAPILSARQKQLLKIQETLANAEAAAAEAEGANQNLINEMLAQVDAPLRQPGEEIEVVVEDDDQYNQSDAAALEAATAKVAEEKAEIKSLLSRLEGGKVRITSVDEVRPAEDYKNGALCLNGKTKLVSLPKLDGFTPLLTLTLVDCRKLTSLPPLPDSLEVLNLDQCIALRELPPFPEGLKALRVCCIKPTKKEGTTTDRERLPPLPEKLKFLALTGCNGLKELALPPGLHTLQMWGSGPESWCELPASLRQMELYGLCQLQLPALPEGLTVLHIEGNVRAASEGAPALRTLGPLPESLTKLVVKKAPQLVQIQGALPRGLQSLTLEGIDRLPRLPPVPPTFKGVLDLRHFLSLRELPDLRRVPHHIVLSFAPPSTPALTAANQGLCFQRNLRGQLEKPNVALRVLLPRHVQPQQPKCCCRSFKVYPERNRTIKTALTDICCGPLYPLALCTYSCILITEVCLKPCDGYPCCPISWKIDRY